MLLESTAVLGRVPKSRMILYCRAVFRFSVVTVKSGLIPLGPSFPSASKIRLKPEDCIRLRHVSGVALSDTVACSIALASRFRGRQGVECSIVNLIALQKGAADVIGRIVRELDEVRAGRDKLGRLKKARGRLDSARRQAQRQGRKKQKLRQVKGSSSRPPPRSPSSSCCHVDREAPSWAARDPRDSRRARR